VNECEHRTGVKGLRSEREREGGADVLKGCGELRKQQVVAFVSISSEIRCVRRQAHDNDEDAL
jgi:hypothetical protein